MTKLEDMSRDELIAAVNGLREDAMRCGNRLNAMYCPFCEGTGFAPALKVQVKDNLLAEWNKPVTQEDWDAWVNKFTDGLQVNG